MCTLDGFLFFYLFFFFQNKKEKKKDCEIQTVHSERERESTELTEGRV